jgi:hypothetical protein
VYLQSASARFISPERGYSGLMSPAELEVTFKLVSSTPEEAGWLAAATSPRAVGLRSLIETIRASKYPGSPTDGSLPSGQRALAGIRVIQEGAQTVWLDLPDPQDTAVATVECDLMDETGRLHRVHVPIELRVRPQ